MLESRNERDLDGIGLLAESETIQPYIETKENPVEILNYIFQNNLMSTFPNPDNRLKTIF